MVSHTVHINSEWSGGKFRLMLSRQEPTEMLCKIHTEKCLFALSVHLTSNEFGVAGCKVGEKSAWNGKRGEGWALSSTAASFSWSVGQTERPPKISASRRCQSVSVGFLERRGRGEERAGSRGRKKSFNPDNNGFALGSRLHTCWGPVPLFINIHIRRRRQTLMS